MATPITTVHGLPERARVEATVASDAVSKGGTGGRHNYGPFENEAQALAMLRDRLVAGLDPLAIRLFGSRGRGSARPDADFDLLVILPDTAGEAALDPRRVYAPVLGLGVGADIVACLAEDFEAERNSPGTLAHDAARGRLVYERALE